MRPFLSSLILFTAVGYGDDTSPETTPLEEIAPELSAFSLFSKKAPPKVNTVPPEVATKRTIHDPETKPISENCRRSPYPMHAGVRHIEGKGIGYQKGYTTFELFLSPDVERFTALPFLDLRGHVFDDRKFALNAGIGFRYRTSCRTYGANVFYDYRGTHRQHYHQIGAGFESLGAVWDFRLNGYLPVGRTDSHWFGTKFDKFKGHYLYLKRKQEFAMRGADAEAGVHFLNNIKRWDLYTAAGPYYFEGKGKNAYGGKMRLGSRWKDFISLEVSGSYDNVFKGIVQGQIGLSVPFGPRSEIKPKTSCTCDDSRKLMERMVQPVARDEIIVVDKHHKNFVARDPSTGQPLFFWFINNQSHSTGTIESPFPMLASALNAANPGEYIYIFPGDGTTNGLNAFATTFQLKDNQQLLGAGFPYIVSTQFGQIEIPPQASGYPNLTANAGTSVIQVANNNTISGLSISADTGGAGFCVGSSVTDVTNLTVTNNLLNSQNAGGGSAVLVNRMVGLLTISNNTIRTMGGDGIVATSQPGSTPIEASYVITDNLILGTASSGVGIGMSTILTSMPCYLSATMKNNVIDNFDSGVFAFFGGRTLYTCLIDGNTVTNCFSQGMELDTNAPSNGQFIITSNNFANNNGLSLFMPATSTCVRFLNNHATPITDIFQLNFAAGLPFHIEPPVGNVPEPLMFGLTLVPANSCGN